MKNSLSFLVRYLKNEDIQIDLDEFLFQAETHPDFPSLFSFSDTLRFFNIDNLAARVSEESLDDLPDSFIALLQPEGKASSLCFVQRQASRYHYWEDKKETSVDRDDFLKLWQKIILVLEKTESTVPSTVQQDKAWPLLPVALTFMMVSMVWQTGFHRSVIITLVLVILGVFLTYEVMKKVFGIHSSFASAVCGATVLTKSGCETVIASEKSKLAGNLKFSDLAVVFFPGQLISLYLLSMSGNFQDFLHFSALSLTLGLPFIAYSLYYQWRVEKNWCTICLIIIGVFTAQLASSLSFGVWFSLSNDISSVVQYLSGFIISGGVWFVIGAYIKSFQELKANETSYVRFKRNYKLFSMALKNSRRIDYYLLKSPIYLGNSNADLKLSLVTNLFCSHCIKVHDQVEEILKRYGNDIRINLRFNLKVHDELTETDLIYFRLLEIYKKDGQETFIKALGSWFHNRDVAAWFSKFGKGILDDDARELFRLQYEENGRNELLFTPALMINEHLYPEMYNRSDLIYFISELIEDIEIDSDQELVMT